jgi:hypothetical protein
VALRTTRRLGLLAWWCGTGATPLTRDDAGRGCCCGGGGGTLVVAGREDAGRAGDDTKRDAGSPTTRGAPYGDGDDDDDAAVAGRTRWGARPDIQPIRASVRYPIPKEPLKQPNGRFSRLP